MLKYMLLVAVTLCSSYGSEIIKIKKDLKCENVQKGSIEYRICIDTNLSTLDKKLNNVYHDFYLLTPELIEAQKNWLKTRNTCKTNACIQKAYEERIVSLKNAVNVQKQFPKTMLDMIKGHNAAANIEISARHNYKEARKFSPECKGFYDDFYQFKNIKVVQPTYYKVDYNNTGLKETLGSCWDMKLDHHAVSWAHFKARHAGIPRLYKKFSIWFSDVDGDGKKDLLFGQNDVNGSRAMVYMLDKALCKKALSNPKFDFWYDQDYISSETMYGMENIIIEYKGKGYLLEGIEGTFYGAGPYDYEMDLTRTGGKDLNQKCYYEANFKNINDYKRNKNGL